MSAAGEKYVEAARQVLGSRRLPAHDRLWVEFCHPVAPGLSRGSTADCFFMESCDYCRDRVLGQRNGMARIFQAAWLAFAALVLSLLPGCAFADDAAPDYRYRLTVEVETPDGLRTGSSVIDVQQTLMRAGGSPANQAVRCRACGRLSRPLRSVRPIR